MTHSCYFRDVVLRHSDTPFLQSRDVPPARSDILFQFGVFHQDHVTHMFLFHGIPTRPSDIFVISVLGCSRVT